MDLSVPTWMYLTLGLSLIVILLIDIFLRFINIQHLIHKETVLLENITLKEGLLSVKYTRFTLIITQNVVETKKLMEVTK